MTGKRKKTTTKKTTTKKTATRKTATRKTTVKQKPKKNILIVDDEPINIKILGETLLSEYKVTICTSGEEAFELATSTTPPDLILLDIIMPDIDGYEVCKRLKKDEKTQNIPIIFISGQSEEKDAGKGFKLGAIDYITKPFIHSIVLARIKTHLELQDHQHNLESLIEDRSQSLIETNRKLQDEVKIRRKTEEALRDKEMDLEIKTIQLEESNAALRVMLRKRDDEKLEFEKKFLFNLKELVIPCVEKMKKIDLDPRQRTYLNILETNLRDIISPFSHELALKYMNFTPSEIQVASFIKQGSATKEIAEILEVSKRTVEFHRENIRKKMGLKGKKGNLRMHLLSL